MSQTSTRQLIENFAPAFKLLEATSDSNGKKFLRFEAEVQRADTRNRNGRVYPRAVLEREVNKMKDRITTGTAFGEADHPSSLESISRQAVLWTNVEMQEDGRVIGTAKVLDTSVGRDLGAILEAGGRPGISSRGAGSVTIKDFEGQQTEMVNPDFNLITFDVVVTPSVETALTSKVFREHMETQQMDFKTLAELKANQPKAFETLMGLLKDGKSFKEAMPEAYAALVDQISEEMKPTLKAIVDERENEIRAAVVAEMKQAGQAPLSEEESTRLQNMTAFANSVIELAREAGLVSENVVISDEEAKSAIETLSAENEAVKTENAKLTSDLAEAGKKLAKIAVTEAIVKKVGDHPLKEELIETLNEVCQKPEDLTANFDHIKTRFDALAARTAKPTARGQSFPGRTAEVAPIVESASTTKKDAAPVEPSAGVSVLQKLAGIGR